MDASTIRLILIVVGALLILLLYLWERHREKREEVYEEDDFIDEEEEMDAPYGVHAYKREPDLGDYGDEDEADYDSYGVGSPRPVERHIDEGPAVKADALDEPEMEGDAPEVPAAPAPAAPSPEPLLMQLSVSARRYPFKGTDVMEVAERCGLYPGDMDIFHCLDEFDDQTRVYFSMANMIKPGTFPFDTMENFSTPGLMLFAQLEGDPEDMTILDEMIATARKLALALNGDVLDDTRRALTVKKEEAMRQAVLDNELRWAKAMMR